MTETDHTSHPDHEARAAPPTPAATMFRIRMTGGTEFGPANLDTIVQWAREGRIPRDALLYPAAHTGGGGEPKSVFAEPRIAAILAAPPTMPSEAEAASAATSSIWMPTGNQPALWGYYIGVASLIPLFIVLTPISLILGVVGLVRAFMKPEAKGLFHAIAAIVLSIGSPLLWWAAIYYFDQYY